LRTITTAHLEVEYGDLGKVMEWCRQNCSGDWAITDISFENYLGVGIYEFQFTDEQDVLMFELRWR
jgi:hypothetical protein